MGGLLLAAIRRRLWVVALLGVVGAAAGTLATFLETPVYASTAQLLVDTRLTASGDFSPNLQDTQLLSQYFMAKATSRSVLESVAQERGLPPSAADGFLKHVSVSVVKGTDLIAVTAESNSPDGAARLANEVANATVALNRQEAEQRFAGRRDELDRQLAQLDSQITSEQVALSKLQIGTGPNADASLAGAISAHQARLNVLQTQYSDTYQQRQTVTAQQDLLAAALSMSEPAAVPRFPVQPVPALYIGGGLLGGLLLGILLALLLDRLDSRIHSAESLAEATGTSMALAVPDWRRQSDSRRAAAYALAWAAVLAENPAPRTLMLVGASSGDSAARSASAIAEAAGRSKRAVVVFGGEDDGAAGSAQGPQAADVGMAGAVQAAPDGTLALPLNQPYWDHGGTEPGEAFDLVVTSVPAPSEHPVAMTLAISTDVAIVVATAGRTRQEEARRTAESLRLAGVPLVASILVTPSEETPAVAKRRTA